MDTRPYYVGGEWRRSDAAFECYSPSDTARLVTRYARATEADVEDALARAAAASADWGFSNNQQRVEILDKAGHLIAARASDFARALAEESGKPLADSTAEVHRAAWIFRFFAGEALRISGERIDSVRKGVDVETTREPVGVVGLITPWNFPVAIPAWKTAPALAFGNCVVLKPSDTAPGCAWLLAQVLHECGLPPGVFNLITASGGVTGKAFTESPYCDAISFTGSVGVGQQLLEAAARRRVRIQLEMGGKNPLVVVDDADLETAVTVAVSGAFQQAGQRCTASSRIIVTDGIWGKFTARFIEKMNAMRVGHSLADGTEIGPVATRAQLNTNQRYLALAREDGATVIGGELIDHDPAGLYMRPAALLDSTMKMRANREEIFGPVAGLIRVPDYDAALAAANDTEFGLSAGICTSSLMLAADFKRKIKAGMVMVNLPTAGVDYHVPFGGRKGSSYGPREQGAYARDFYTIVKTAYTGYA